MKPNPNHIALGQQYALALQFLQKIGHSGQYMGQSAGSSTDFLDHRPYVPGDDIRRLDWKAFARTDQLLVKRFQEEIRPSVHLWIDTSQSMGLTQDKLQLLTDLVAFLVVILQRMDVQCRVILLGQGVASFDQILEGDWNLCDCDPLQSSYLKHLQEIAVGGHLILISDFLTLHDPNRVLPQILQRAQTLTGIQILDREDLDFEEGTAILLEDSETGQVIEVDLTSEIIQGYHQKLTDLQNDWRYLLAGRGQFESFSTKDSFAVICERLMQVSFLEPVEQ